MDLSMVVQKLTALLDSGMLERSVAKAVEEALWCVKEDIAHEGDPKEISFKFLKDHVGETLWFVNAETKLRGSAKLLLVDVDRAVVCDTFSGMEYHIKFGNGWLAYEFDDLYLYP